MRAGRVSHDGRSRHLPGTRIGPDTRVRPHRSPAIPITAYVSTYAPHRCGIATFTHDLASSAGPHHVVALHPPSGPDAYPREVRHRIRRDVLSDYLVVADALNASGTDVVSIQHEYGIWGGD